MFSLEGVSCVFRDAGFGNANAAGAGENSMNCHGFVIGFIVKIRRGTWKVRSAAQKTGRRGERFFAGLL